MFNSAETSVVGIGRWLRDDKSLAALVTVNGVFQVTFAKTMRARARRDDGLTFLDFGRDESGGNDDQTVTEKDENR